MNVLEIWVMTCEVSKVEWILLVYLFLLQTTSVKHVSMVKKHKQKLDKILAHRTNEFGLFSIFIEAA